MARRVTIPARVLFNSVEFAIFFTVVFIIYWLIRSSELRAWFLLGASYYFYMSWNAQLAGVVACSSLADFLIAVAMDTDASERRRKMLLMLSIVMNLSLLFYFKYANFFLDSLHTLLAQFGLHQRMPVLDVILPIGISFYTFEAISYTVDVYSRRAAAEKNPFHFLLFITFFPRMVAGPIIRAKNFLPQLRREKSFSWGRFELGLQFILMGLFKKLAIADRMSCLVDPVYQNPDHYCSGAAWVAVIAYSLQVYGDFSGYSDIALGTAHMLGFKLPENFNMPYISRNIAEFWRRWHISLSTWLRDYVFIPAGGSRGTQWKTSFTLFLTMTLCGLWHGAKWTLVGFGMVQGLMMITHRFFRHWCKAHPARTAFLETPWGVVSRVLFTYWTFIVSLVIFRAADFRVALEMFHRMFTPQAGFSVRHPVGPWSLVFAFAVVAVSSVLVNSGDWKKMAGRLTPFAWGLAYTVILVLTFKLMPETQKAFIYFQF